MSVMDMAVLLCGAWRVAYDGNGDPAECGEASIG